MPTGNQLFIRIVNNAAKNASNEYDIADAVNSAIKEHLSSSDDLEALMSFVESQASYKKISTSSYENMLSFVKGEVEKKISALSKKLLKAQDKKFLPSAEASDTPDDIFGDLDEEEFEGLEAEIKNALPDNPVVTMLNREVISPKRCWYIKVMQTLMDWDDVKYALSEELAEPEILHEIAMPLNQTVTVNMATFESREDAEEVWENSIPTANLINRDGDIYLEVVDLEMGIIDFRTNKHPLIEPDNATYGYEGDEYIYLDPVEIMTMIANPETGLWFAISDSAYDDD